jgi:hypothetical protein
MKFEDIQYFQRSGDYPPSFGLYTQGGFWVEETYFVRAWKLISTACPQLRWKGEQTTETLCCDPDWCDRPYLARMKLGRCVKYFMQHDILELIEINKGKGGKRIYRSPRR